MHRIHSEKNFLLPNTYDSKIHFSDKEKCIYKYLLTQPHNNH